MLRPLVQRLVVLIAFAAGLLICLAPSLARAALLPVCENHQLTRMPVEWIGSHAEPRDACSAAELADEENDMVETRVAAMCDDRGASVVAPARVLPIVDARLDATPGCGVDASAPVIGPGPKDSPLSAPAFALAQHALLGDLVLVPPPQSDLAPAYPAVVGAERAGVTRGVDHPPRLG